MHKNPYCIYRNVMSENRVIFHENCNFCGKNGLIINDYKKSGNTISASQKITSKHEGWPGIPHGGLSISALIELADFYGNISSNYPIHGTFRFGGGQLFTGDTVDILVTREGNSYNGTINKVQKKNIYLRGDITKGSIGEFTDEESEISELIQLSSKSKSSFKIPDFANRIVFNNKYRSTHQRRIFELRELFDKRIYILCSFQDRNGRTHCKELNRIKPDQIHPGTLVTLLDETMGWAGFLTAWQGGLTVDLHVHLLRPIHPDENIISYGICDNIRGLYNKKLVTCTGGVFSLKEKRYEPVAYAKGRWLTIQGFKEKMLKSIIPGKNILLSEIIKSLDTSR